MTRSYRRSKTALMQKYGLTEDSGFWRRILTEAFMDQLDRCKDEAARRLLLGLSR